MLYLVGMPGGGKSSVGRLLSRQLEYELVDCDTEAQRRAGCTVREYFERHGEAAFRDLEEAVLQDLAGRGSRARLLVATGGGVVLREANRARLRASGTVIYLHSTPEELMRRLRHDTQRPLLQVADPLQRLRELFQQRDPLYREVAHYRFEAGRSGLPALVRTIAMQLELAGLAGVRAPSAAADVHRTLKP